MAQDDADRAMAEARARWTDHIREVAAPLTAWMLDRLDLQRGQTVLDIAAGAGDPGFEVAQRLGPDGVLIATDIAPSAIEVGRRRAHALGLANVTFRVMDAQRMDLRADSVDRALCRWGFMLMPDPGAALSETRRVVRPGGRLAFAVWGTQAQNPWARRIRRTVEAMGRIERVDPSAPAGMFSLPDEPVIRSVVEQAGWRMLELAEIPLSWRYPDFDAYWAYASETAGDAGPVLAAMTAPELATVRQTVEADASEFRERDGGYRFPGLSSGVLAD